MTLHKGPTIWLLHAAGALLSAHHMLITNQSIMPEYDGSLLRFAHDLGDRLLPAFETPYGVPLSWINLQKVRAICCR